MKKGISIMESNNQLCGTVRGRRLTDSELVNAVRRIMAEEQKTICFSHTSTNANDNYQQASITSLNQDQA